MNENESTYIIRDASKSFPSGHASISVYGSISLAVSKKLDIFLSYITYFVPYYFLNLL